MSSTVYAIKSPTLIFNPGCCIIFANTPSSCASSPTTALSVSILANKSPG